MASALVRNQMCTRPRLIKFICAIIICSSFGRVSSDSHLSDRAKIAFRTIGRPFRLPLICILIYSPLLQWCINMVGGCHMYGLSESNYFNSLAPGKFEWNFRYLISQIISLIDGWVISSELALRWMSLDLTDDKSTLVQVMAWCRQATSHYLSQYWPRSLSPYGVTRPQWVKPNPINLYQSINQSQWSISQINCVMI